MVYSIAGTHLGQNNYNGSFINTSIGDITKTNLKILITFLGLFFLVSYSALAQKKENQYQARKTGTLSQGRY